MVFNKPVHDWDWGPLDPDWDSLNPDWDSLDPDWDSLDPDSVPSRVSLFN